MAERIVQEESLVAVADAIRAKGGTTDALSFPTGFADAISAIQTGGGGGGIATGTFVLDEDSKTVEITHNVGSVPKIALYYLESDKDCIRDVNVSSGYAFFGYSIDGTKNGVYYKTGSSITSSLSLGTMATSSQYVANHASNEAVAEVLWNANDMTATLVSCGNDSGAKFRAGNKYRWIVIAE